MALPKHRSADVPDYDYYPAPSPRATPTAGEGLQENPPLGRPVHIASRDSRGPLLRVVSAVASVPRQVARIPGAIGRRLEIVSRRAPDSETLEHAADTAQETYEQVREEAAHRLDALREAAGQTLHAMRESAYRAWYGLRRGAAQGTAGAQEAAGDAARTARLQAERLRRDYPLQVILAAGAAGFLLGAALRMAQSNRRSRYAREW